MSHLTFKINAYHMLSLYFNSIQCMIYCLSACSYRKIIYYILSHTYVIYCFCWRAIYVSNKSMSNNTLAKHLLKWLFAIWLRYRAMDADACGSTPWLPTHNLNCSVTRGTCLMHWQNYPMRSWDEIFTKTGWEIFQ